MTPYQIIPSRYSSPPQYRDLETRGISSVFFKCPGRRRNSAIDLVVLTLERCISEQENTNAYTTVSRHPLILKGSLFAANLGKKCACMPRKVARNRVPGRAGGNQPTACRSHRGCMSPRRLNIRANVGSKAILRVSEAFDGWNGKRA